MKESTLPQPPDMSKNELLTDAEALCLGRSIEQIHRDLPGGVEFEITLGHELFVMTVDAYGEETFVGNLFLKKVSKALEHQLQVALQNAAAKPNSPFDGMDY